VVCTKKHMTQSSHWDQFRSKVPVTMNGAPACKGTHCSSVFYWTTICYLYWYNGQSGFINWLLFKFVKWYR